MNATTSQAMAGTAEEEVADCAPVAVGRRFIVVTNSMRRHAQPSDHAFVGSDNYKPDTAVCHIA
jgi:hypothetical protein